jgi:hypothetical protein
MNTMTNLPPIKPLTNEQMQRYAHWNTARLIVDPTGLYKKDIQALLNEGFTFLVERGNRTICVIPLNRPGDEVSFDCSASIIENGTRKIVSSSFETDILEAVDKFAKGFAWVKKAQED